MASPSTSPITPDLIEELKALFPAKDQVVTPDSPGYGKALQRWSDLASKRAGAIVYAETVQDVQRAILFTTKHTLDLAVKAGGHTPDGGNSTAGLVLDLTRLNTVTLDQGSKTLTAGGGALWRDVHAATAGTPFAVVSSSVGTTGVGGVTLQGGFGYLIGSHGLVIDNLVSVQIVTSDGVVRSASEAENAELFWAVRGAGTNFGVVTQFVFVAHEQRKDVVAGSLLFTADKLEAILEALGGALWWDDGQLAAQCVCHFPEGSEQVMLSVTLFCNGSEEVCRERLAGVFALESERSDVRVMAYEEANATLDSFSTPGRRKRLLGFEFVSPLRPQFVQDLLDELQAKVDAEPDLRRTYIDIEFWDLRKVARVPTDATAFPNRVNVQKGSISLDYEDASKDEEYLEWATMLQSKFQEEFRRAGFEPNRLVSNFIYYLKPADAADMFGGNGERLAQLKRKYDPQGIFNKLNPIRI
ncbi:FAD-binding oxidoreductase [Aspergillus mulundensis]|uniref:6-hydroxy-D-nicotine oxidase n=1 Tax=Aspergillus mulundensis TaxID=1810919 RepID=A0A3D8SYA0_9EURO|nr:6-hydroxy-D-nicotine oxidase [Aspergillus mulundensis]RDW90748.1 6-hydroxy-D-nicotine oxidase [Aspergillus mulundensis]